MRSWIKAIWFSLLVAMLFCMPGAAFAQAPLAGEGENTPDQGLPTIDGEITSFGQNLKAVLVVGPVVDDAWTAREKTNMDLAAQALMKYGVQVIKFYTPTDSWDKIVTAARGAQFFLYRGHGVAWGGDPLVVGGMKLTDKFISPDDIRNQLRLANRAIVMLYGCWTAGSSGDSNELITSAEAQRRVAQYADPFMDIGAGGYFADWWPEAFPTWIDQLFAGKTLGQSYEAFWDYNASTVERYQNPLGTWLNLWLDKDPKAKGGYEYNYAFVGHSESTLVQLFTPVNYTHSVMLPLVVSQ